MSLAEKLSGVAGSIFLAKDGGTTVNATNKALINFLKGRSFNTRMAPVPFGTAGILEA
jgi:lysophospholipid acyltransferase (LPLAT)-like uncharacterized protein